jgi:hypothetical protein
MLVGELSYHISWKLSLKCMKKEVCQRLRSRYFCLCRLFALYTNLALEGGTQAHLHWYLHPHHLLILLLIVSQHYRLLLVFLLSFTIILLHILKLFEVPVLAVVNFIVHLHLHHFIFVLFFSQ